MADDSSEADIYYNMGVTYSENGEYDKAIEYYKKAIQLNPGDQGAYYNLGNTYFIRRDYTNAIACFQNAIQLKPDSDDAYVGMGNALREQGNADKAIESYQKAISLRPDPIVLHNLGCVMMSEKGDKARAMEYFAKAAKLGNAKSQEILQLNMDRACAFVEDYILRLLSIRDLFFSNPHAHTVPAPASLPNQCPFPHNRLYERAVWAVGECKRLSEAQPNRKEGPQDRLRTLLDEAVHVISLQHQPLPN